MHSKNLRDYLDSAAGITGLLPQAERLIELRRIYSRVVPEQLLRSSSVVNYKQRIVVIFAENNAIAAKLRLLSPRLVNDFSKCGVEVTGIRLQVQPRLDTHRRPAPKLAKLTPAGYESLRALSEKLPDSKLKQALAAMLAHENGESAVPPAEPPQQRAAHQRKP